MKVALVHDFLREYGGAERVVEAMHQLWPEAPLYTSFVDWKSLGAHAERFKGWDIRPSWVQHNWFVRTFHSPLRFLAPKIWESFDLSEYDVVIASSGWFMCRGVRAGRRGLAIRDSRFGEKENRNEDYLAKLKTLNSKFPIQICYIHHPPRNLYGYATGSNWQKYPWVRAYTTVVNFFLRHYDFETAQKVDYFVANSKETARRVQKFYRRDSMVIYPPVEVQRVNASMYQRVSENAKKFSTHRHIDTSTPGYFLSVGRLTYAKRLDVVIEACNKLKLPLKIVGSGNQEKLLRSIAGPTIEFIGSVSDEELDKLYAGAKAFIFCALDEDFGMVPVEAMGHGVPVVALAQGGVKETVVDGKTGVLFSEPTVESLEGALKRYNNVTLSPKACIAQAKKFSKARFQKEFKQFVERSFRPH